MPGGVVARLGNPERNGRAALVQALGFTADGKHLISATLDGDFHLWDVATGKPCPGTQEERTLLRSPWLAVAGRTWPLLCEDELPGKYDRPASEDAIVRKLQRLEQLPGFLNCSADGKRILAYGQGKDRQPLLVVSDSRDKKVLREFFWKDDNGDNTISAALSPDGRTIAAANWSNLVCFFDIATGDERRYRFRPPWGIPTFPLCWVKFSPDGLRLVIAGVDGLLRVLSLADGRVLVEIQETDCSLGGIGDFASSVAFSPDGKTLATGKSMHFLRIWEVSTGQLIRQQRGGTLLFSPDNRLVAVLKRDTIRLHDLYSGALVHEHGDPSGFVGNLAFSPDGRLLAASCGDGTIVIWDTIPWQESPVPQPLDDRTLEELWKDLEEAEPGRNVEKWMKNYVSEWRQIEEGRSACAYQAMGRLIGNPAQSVPFLKKRLHVAPPADARRLRQLTADLDHPTYARREAASRALAELGMAAAPALRTALAKNPTPEMRWRLERLLAVLQQKEASRSYLRAIQALERIGTDDARQLLKILADGTASDLATNTDALEALRRIQTKTKTR
jgi:WD40 repeat protein